MSKNDDWAKLGCSVIMLVGILLCCLVWWVFRSQMEASAYNRATGSEVSTWDAMWIELRVQSSPRE